MGLCSPKAAQCCQPFATLRKCSQPSASGRKALHSDEFECIWSGFESASKLTRDAPIILVFARGGVCVSDLCRGSYSDVCRGGVCVNDLCCRSCIGVRRDGVCVCV